MVTGFYKTTKITSKGMTLTELAIVLLCMGLVLGTIWAVVGVVWNNYRVYKANEQLMQVVQNVRDFYGPIGGLYSNSVTKALIAADGNPITGTLDANRLIPIEMRSNPAAAGNPINHAMSAVAGGSFTVDSRNLGRSFRVHLFGLSIENCIRELTQLPVLMPELGVTRIGANASSSNINLANIAAPGSVTPAVAMTWCNAAPATNNEVTFEFRIQN